MINFILGKRLIIMTVLFTITTVVVSLLLLQTVKSDLIEEPGAKVKATQGGVWPKPQEQTLNDEKYFLNPYDFKFVVGS